MKWVTREHLHVDRTAIPWLVKRFIDPEAEFLFVPVDRIDEAVKNENAIPYDAPGVELGHKGDKCSFDAIVDKYKLRDPALLCVAKIVRGADTDHPETAPESAGLDSIMTGISINARDDYEAIKNAAIVYEALYSNCKLASLSVKHEAELGRMDRGQKREFLKEKMKE